MRRSLPFPPGRDAEEFEVYIDRTIGASWSEYQINLLTLEVFARAGGRWSAPGWLALPERVRARVWALSAQA